MLALLAVSSATADEQYYPPPDASGGWRRLVDANATPSESQNSTILTTAGLDWNVLKQAWDATSQYGGTFLVIRKGWVAAEWGNVSAVKAIASCTKTLTGLAMQRMFEMSSNGSFSNPIGPDDLAYLYLPASWGDDATRRTISIRHLLTMSSGLVPNDNPPSPSSDTTAYQQKMLAPAVRSAPGVEWIYASLPVDILTLVTERVTGSKLANFFQTEIGSKIGVTSLKWGALGTHSYASAYSSMNGRDLARVAYLMLRRGTWEGVNIVSGARIDAMTQWDSSLASTVYGPQVQFPTDPETHLRFGDLAWTNRTESPHVGVGVPSDAYYCAGFKTIFAMVIPSLDLIIVRIQDGPTPWSDSVFTGITTRVIQAVQDGPSTQPPTVSLTNPTNGANFAAPSTITLEADAADSDGNVVQVEFYAGSSLINTSFTAPYSVSWPDVNAGNYVLTARATDDNGAITTSDPIIVSVTGSGGSGANILLNAGGPAYVDSFGREWQSDSGFFTSGVSKVASEAVNDTIDDALYQNWRESSGSSSRVVYSVPLPNGDYQIYLHFAEMASKNFKVGGRVFDVKAESATVLSKLDVYAEAGRRAALIRTVNATVADGDLTIRFVRRVGNPMISAIEIVGL